jgi:BTB/POZ domain-containing protein KCTD9
LSSSQTKTYVGVPVELARNQEDDQLILTKCLRRNISPTITLMKRRKPFNKIEEDLLTIPTWRFVSEWVVLLALLALLVAKDIDFTSPREVVRVLFQNAEAIAIVAAVILYFKEIPDRKAQKHYEAWQVIDNAAAANVPTSYARKQALEDLSRSGVSLAGIDVPRANLSRADLNGADLSRADLNGADLSRADLNGANLSKADLNRANLSLANLNLANLMWVNLWWANLSGAELNRANLRWAKLSGANLSRAKLSGANLSRAKLSGANLSGANLSGANLSRAKLSGANLSRANLSGANLSGAKFGGTNLSRANLNRANLSGANLSGANLSRANLSGANLSRVKNVSPQQIQSARNWKTATYDPELRIQLGLDAEPQQLDDKECDE